MRDLARSGLPSLSLFKTKAHMEEMAFVISPASLSARYWILGIFSLNSWLIRPCFSLLYESSHT